MINYTRRTYITFAAQGKLRKVKEHSSIFLSNLLMYLLQVNRKRSRTLQSHNKMIMLSLFAYTVSRRNISILPRNFPPRLQPLKATTEKCTRLSPKIFPVLVLAVWIRNGNNRAHNLTMYSAILSVPIRAREAQSDSRRGLPVCVQISRVHLSYSGRCCYGKCSRLRLKCVPRKR